MNKNLQCYFSLLTSWCPTDKLSVSEYGSIILSLIYIYIQNGLWGANRLFSLISLLAYPKCVGFGKSFTQQNFLRNLKLNQGFQWRWKQIVQLEYQQRIPLWVESWEAAHCDNYKLEVITFIFSQGWIQCCTYLPTKCGEYQQRIPLIFYFQTQTSCTYLPSF